MKSTPQRSHVEVYSDGCRIGGAASKQCNLDQEQEQNINMDNNNIISNSSSASTTQHIQTPPLRRSSRRRTIAPIYFRPNNSGKFESGNSSSSNSTTSNYSSSSSPKKVKQGKPYPIYDNSNIINNITTGHKTNNNNNKRHISINEHPCNQENVPPCSSSSSMSTSLTTKVEASTSTSTPTQTTIVPNKTATMSSLSHQSGTSSLDYLDKFQRTLPQIQVHSDTLEKEADKGNKPSLSSLSSSSSSDMNSLCNGVTNLVNVEQGVKKNYASEYFVVTRTKLRRSKRIRKKKEKRNSKNKTFSSPSLSSSLSSSSMSISTASSPPTTSKDRQHEIAILVGQSKKEENEVSVSIQKSDASGIELEEVSEDVATECGKKDDNSLMFMSSIAFDQIDELDENYKHLSNVQVGKGTILSKTKHTEGKNNQMEVVDRRSPTILNDKFDLQLNNTENLVTNVVTSRRRRSLRRRKSLSLPERYRDDNTLLYLKPPSKFHKDIDSPSSSEDSKSSAKEENSKNEPIPIDPGSSSFTPSIKQKIRTRTVKVEQDGKKSSISLEEGHNTSSNNNYTNHNCSSVADKRIKEGGNNEPADIICIQEKASTEPYISNRNMPKKRRRRSSAGLHTGGFISLADIAKIEKEAAIRQKRRSPDSVGIHSDVGKDVGKDEEDSSYCKSDKNEVTDKGGLLTTNASIDTSEAPLNHGNRRKRHNCGDGQVVKGHKADFNENCMIKAHEIKNTITTLLNFEEVLTKVRTSTYLSVSKIFRNTPHNCKIVSFLPSQPCMSARIFSCATILFEKQITHSITDSSEIPLPLLEAFVKAELASLMDTKAEYVRPTKKVHFCSTNNCSIFTPVDTEEGSEKIIEHCISSTYKVLTEINHLRKQGKDGNICALISVLQDIISSNHLLVECSKVRVNESNVT